jgi:hypothetical protein
MRLLFIYSKRAEREDQDMEVREDTFSKLILFWYKYNFISNKSVNLICFLTTTGLAGRKADCESR